MEKQDVIEVAQELQLEALEERMEFGCTFSWSSTPIVCSWN